MLIERVWKWVVELEVAVLQQIHATIESEVAATELRLCKITEKRLRESIQEKLSFIGVVMVDNE